MFALMGVQKGNGVGPLLFAILCFIIALAALWILVVSLTIHSLVRAMLNFSERKFFKAACWFSLFAMLVFSEFNADFFNIRGCKNYPPPVAGETGGCWGWHWNAEDRVWEMDHDA